MKEANIRDGTPALIADISIRGLWQPQAVALLDVRVVDTDAPSHIHRNTVAVLSSAEEEKKRKYNSAAKARRASFTPFVVSTDGMLGREANFLLKRLAQSISIKWEKPLGQTTGWLRAKLSFAILRATNLCLRGSRTKWRSGVGMDDGAGLPAELPINTFISFLCSVLLFIYLHVLFVCHISVCRLFVLLSGYNFSTTLMEPVNWC